jgi:hypothetical protein
MAGARGLVNPDFNLPCLQNNFQGTSQVRSAYKFSEFKVCTKSLPLHQKLKLLYYYPLNNSTVVHDPTKYIMSICGINIMHGILETHKKFKLD